MTDNVMMNVTGIEMGQLVLDGSAPTNCIMIQTMRNKYCFRLSETFPVEKQYEMFRQFVVDVNTPLQEPETQDAPSPDGVEFEHEEELAKHEAETASEDVKTQE